MKHNVNKNSRYLVIACHVSGPLSNNLHVFSDLTLTKSHGDTHMFALSAKEDTDTYRG